jgi:predicted phage terminase large subunit-like protein
LQKESHKKNLTIPVIELLPHKDKDLRIMTLQPWIKNGWIRFRKNMRELKRQFIYYRPKGKGGHDDGPDAVEMLKSMIEKNVGPIEFKSTGKRVGSEMEGYTGTSEARNYL